MNNIEKIKFYLGLSFLSLSLIAGLIFLFENFLDINLSFKYTNNKSLHPENNKNLLVALNTPLFFGLCAIAGAWLLNSVKKSTN